MIILDVETTGFDFIKDSILSIGAVDYYHPDEKFYGECRALESSLKDLNRIHESLKYNGFTMEDIIDESKKSAPELAKSFIDWAMGREIATIAGLSPYFDVRFVEAAAKSGRYSWPFGHRTVDIHSLFYDYMEKNNLPIPMENQSSRITGDYISSFVGIPAEPRPHNALNGAIWETEALYRLRNSMPYLDDFKKFPVPHYIGIMPLTVLMEEAPLR